MRPPYLLASLRSQAPRILAPPSLLASKSISAAAPLFSHSTHIPLKIHASRTSRLSPCYTNSSRMRLIAKPLSRFVKPKPPYSMLRSKLKHCAAPLAPLQTQVVRDLTMVAYTPLTSTRPSPAFTFPRFVPPARCLNFIARAAAKRNFISLLRA